MADVLHRSDGYASPELRQGASAFTASVLLGEDGGDAVPEALRPYLRKLATQAYRITDDDIAALRSAGYSEDQIFELSASGALGAALAQMDRGLAALEAARAAKKPAGGDS